MQKSLKNLNFSFQREIISSWPGNLAKKGNHLQRINCNKIKKEFVDIHIYIRPNSLFLRHETISTTNDGCKRDAED